MKLGSHNSLSYLPPRKWYMRPFNFVAKCQSKTYQEQYALGVRFFDLRFRPTENIVDEPIIAHGPMEFSTYNGFMDDFLTFLNHKAQINPNEDIYIRVIYELNVEDKSSTSEIKENNFIQLCKKYQEKYPYIHFTGGNRKYDWKELVKLEAIPPHDQLIASMTWKKWDDWCPRLYAFFMNGINKKKYKNDTRFILFDFI